MKKIHITLLLNTIAFILVLVGVYIMLHPAKNKGLLTSSGFANLKYFTVLSNLLYGAAAFFTILYILMKYAKTKTFTFSFPLWFQVAKLVSATAVGVTFLVIAAFLGPIYGHASMYQGSNLYFHLIVPLLALADFLIMEAGSTFTFRYIWLSIIPTLIYGICYLANILINGVGTWPDTNDWYGFMNWGLPVGIVIFFMNNLMSFGIAALLWKFRRKSA